jgi:hypothetical protein
MRATNGKFRDIVDRTQPTWDPGTVNLFQRLALKTPLARLIPGVMFSSQRNKNTMMALRAIVDWANGGYKAAEIPKMAAKVALPTLINSIGLVTISAIGKAFLGGIPDDPKKEDLWWGSLFYQVLSRTLGNFMVAGDLMASIVEAIDARRRGIPAWMQDRSDNHLQGTWKEAVSLAWNIADAIEARTPKQEEKAASRALGNAMRFAEPLTGLPLSDVIQTYKQLEKQF